MTGSEDLFADNEGKADHYTVVCLRFAAGVVAVMWFLNLLGFFIVDQTMMNLVMPLGMVLLLLPGGMEKSRRWPLGWKKYAMMCCFVLGIALMFSVLTIQMILAWACPVILSCHDYSPRFTRFTTLGTLAFMLLSFYAGI